MRLRVDRDRGRAERRDEAVHEPVTLRLGRARRRQEPGRAVEQVGGRVRGAVRLRAGDRVAADEARVAERAGNVGLRRADVGDGRLGAAVEQVAHDRVESSHGHRDDDQVGVAELARGAARLVDRSALARDLQHLVGEVEPRHVRDAGSLRSQPDGGADQARADDAEPLDLHAAQPMRLPSSSTTDRTSRANSPNSAVGICCGPSQSASSGDGMRLDDDPVRAHRGSRPRQRQHQVAPAGRVRRVDDHRQVRLVLQHRDRAEVERVPRRPLEGLDPALAEDDPLVSLARDVLGRHQQLLDRRRRPALQQDRLVGPPHLGEQHEVLHVPRADLDHVRGVQHRLHVPRVHQLGHDRQPGLFARLAQDHERLLAEPLERVRRGPRLERAAAQPRRAGLVDRARRLERLLAVLDRARPRDQAEELVPDLPAVDVDHRRVGRDLTRDELVRLQDRQHLLDAGIALERQRRQQLALADRADHGRLAPARDARVHARLLQPREHVLGLVRRRARAHHDQQLGGSVRRHRGGKGSCDTERHADFQRDQSLRREDPRQLHRAASASTRRPRSRARRSSASSTCTRSRRRSSRASCARRRSTSPRCCSRPASTPTARTVFVQSHVTAHPEAAWLLGSVTSFGELRRMTQFKDRAAEQDFVSAGLFTYPVLMAGDILLYQTDLVPVGDDQRQHVELTRDIAERFNQRFGETFVVPEVSIPEDGARIKNLQEPERLMSTTRGAPQGVVRLVDPPETVRKKFKTAVTDSGSDVRHDPAEKAGHLEPDRDHGRRHRRLDPRDRGALRRPGLRPVQAGRGRGGRRAADPDPAALRGAARGRAAAQARCSPAAPTRPVRPPPPRSSRCTSGWASSGHRDARDPSGEGPRHNRSRA